jgi:hypothetical protein
LPFGHIDDKKGNSYTIKFGHLAKNSVLHFIHESANNEPSSDISSGIILAKLSCHGLVRMPRCSAIKEQSNAEFAGLFARVGYASVGMGITVFTVNESYCRAASKIASAKPCQVVTPPPQ